MATSIQDRSAVLVQQVHSEGYYTDRFYRLLTKHKMSPESICRYMHDDKALVAMWNDFWFALPDSPSIRHGAFFPLCDLCEEIFEDETED